MANRMIEVITILEQLKQDWQLRPWWMNLTFYFYVYMTFIYMPFDVFTKPFERWEEVWFGFVMTGWAAKVTEPLHWLIYAAGAFGFWKMKPWMWPWAAVYAAQITIAMVVFNFLEAPVAGATIEARGGGPIMAAISGALFLALTVALWRTKPLFTDDDAALVTDQSGVQ
jgi:hypothetical protein